MTFCKNALLDPGTSRIWKGDKSLCYTVDAHLLKWKLDIHYYKVECMNYSCVFEIF